MAFCTCDKLLTKHWVLCNASQKYSGCAERSVVVNQLLFARLAFVIVMVATSVAPSSMHLCDVVIDMAGLCCPDKGFKEWTVGSLQNTSQIGLFDADNTVHRENQLSQTAPTMGKMRHCAVVSTSQNVMTCIILLSIGNECNWSHTYWQCCKAYLW